MLRAAAADAFILARERRKGLDRRTEIAAFECREAARQLRQIGAGRVTPLPRQLLHPARTRVERGIIVHNGLSQDDVQVGEPAARRWQRARRIIV